MNTRMDKQLNVWIDGDLKEMLATKAQQKKCSMKDLIEDYIRQDMASDRAAQLQEQALPFVREIMQSELRRAFARLQTELHEEQELQTQELKDDLRRRTDRLGALMVRAVRDAGIVRRLVYALLAKTYGPAFAEEAYAHANGKSTQEIAAKQISSAPIEEAV